LSKWLVALAEESKKCLELLLIKCEFTLRDQQLWLFVQFEVFGLLIAAEF